MSVGFLFFTRPPAGVSFRPSTGSAGTDGGEDEEEAKGGRDSRRAIVSVRSRSRAYHPSAVDVVVNDESKKLRTVSLSEPTRGKRFGVSAREEYRNLALSRAEPVSRDLGDASTHRRALQASRPGTDKTSIAW